MEEKYKKDYKIRWVKCISSSLHGFTKGEYYKVINTEENIASLPDYEYLTVRVWNDYLEPKRIALPVGITTGRVCSNYWISGDYEKNLEEIMK